MAPLDVTPMLAPERAMCLDLLRSLAPDDWGRPTECPEWNVKGVALHILGDDLSLLARQRDATPDQGLILYAKDHPGLTFRELLDGFNEQWVTASMFMSSDLLLELLRLVGEWSDDFYCNVGLDVIAREPVGFFASADPSPYWHVIAREYAERVIHQSQIRRAVGASEVSGDVLATMALVVAHALAAWMRDLAPPTGTQLAIDFGSAGAFTWEREPERWSVSNGVAPAASATITISPDQVVAALTRGVTPAELSAATTVTGDQALAHGALEIVAPLVAAPSA
jgi:uncharacterized protein (TIGR03083 family)